MTAGKFEGLIQGKCEEMLRVVSVEDKWLPDKDSNLDKLLQRQLCYRYTIGQSALRSY